MSYRVLTTFAALVVQQTTRYAGQCNLAGVFILKFVEAAFSTAVAKRFPFFGSK
jgi:hypothetical protein